MAIIVIILFYINNMYCIVSKERERMVPIGPCWMFATAEFKLVTCPLAAIAGASVPDRSSGRRQRNLPDRHRRRTVR